MGFDPNSTATTDSGIFGLPFSREESKLVLIPVPWEVTTSYGDGTSRGPEAVFAASHQVDLFDIETGDVYQNGYFMEEIPQDIVTMNDEMKSQALKISSAIEQGGGYEPQHMKMREQVNEASKKLNQWVYKTAKKALDDGKIPAVLGGDHSSPFGALQALSEKHGRDFGILHVDAHADLRDAYQGFKHSHASIMFNVMEADFSPAKLVQLGIRDFSPGEYAYIQKNEAKVKTYFDPLVKRRLNKGESWQAICDEVISHLPKKVYVSFDIDGLNPDLCPNTGTPVPGGLSFDQALTLFASLHESGKQIIGFDLCEVSQPEASDTSTANSEWDGNVGARILFKLCGWTMVTNGFKAKN